MAFESPGGLGDGGSQGQSYNTSTDLESQEQGTSSSSQPRRWIGRQHNKVVQEFGQDIGPPSPSNSGGETIAEVEPDRVDTKSAEDHNIRKVDSNFDSDKNVISEVDRLELEPQSEKGKGCENVLAV